jgi:cystathionine beta-lyase/cystathionine gamma-synthase
MEKFLTKCVHSGTFHSDMRAVSTPIYQSSTFLLKSEDYEKIAKGRARDINIYSRYSNPTRKSVEEKIIALTGAEDAIGFSSGMGAISTTLLTFLNPKDRILTTIDLYGGTYSFIKNLLSRFNIDYVLVNPENTDEIIKNMGGSRVILFESLSNPLLKMVDIEEIAENKKEGQLLIIDNTFLTPYNFNPLYYGADIEIHSASKYLNGHSDLIGGFVCGSKELIEKIWPNMIEIGASMEPIEAFLLGRGMKTLGLRMEKHNQNSKKVAEFLIEHKEIEEVFHPALECYHQKELRDKYLKLGTGGVVTFVVKGGIERGVRFMHSLRIIKEAASLGGVESLISMPFYTSQRSLNFEEREKIGILPGTVRLSCGIEDEDDILEDINQALAKTS